ncbi:MAG: hypothetical protein ACRETX_14510, partial [Steroidobacteraceae bacterium]
ITQYLLGARRPTISLERPGEPAETALATVIVQNTAPWTYFGSRAVNACPDASFDTGLDVMAMRALRDLLNRLRNEGHCVLFSSHVMHEVASLCDEVVIIAHGKVVAQGTPEQIRERTGTATLEDAFVAAIGTGEGLQ